VIAFEPLPKLYAKVHQSPGVDARNLALGDFQRRIRIYVPRSTGGCDPSVYKYTADMEEVEVEMDTLDCRLATELWIDLLKIDVEGHEMVVIAGGREVLKKN
jgi:FkbM family methyltransferase